MLISCNSFVSLCKKSLIVDWRDQSLPHIRSSWTKPSEQSLVCLFPFFLAFICLWFCVFHFDSCYFWISKLLYLDFQILLSTEAVTRLSHDQIALFKTFRGTAQNCARQAINHAASRIKQAQLQLCG